MSAFLTEAMPGPPPWVQEWHVPPPPPGTWFRVVDEEWDGMTRRVFTWATSVRLVTSHGTLAVEVVPTWG